MPDLSKASVRGKLARRKEPHWQRIAKGNYLGFYRGVQGDTWVARYRSVEGKQVYRALDRAQDFDSADKLAREWFAACGRGVVRAGSVWEACLAYIAAIQVEKDAFRGGEIAARLKRRVCGAPIGAIALDALLPHDIETWRNGLIEIETKASANRDLAALRAALNRAYRGGLIASDHAWRTVRPFAGVDNVRTDYLTLTQRRALLKAAKGSAVGDLIAGAAHTAARPIELFRVTVADLDLQHHNLTLTGYKGRGGQIRRRTVPLTPAALPFFRRLAKGKAPTEHLFLDPDGRPWKHSGHDELFRAVRDAAGLPASVTLYVVRHSIIASWLSAGIDVQTVSKVAGTGLAMLSRNYTKFIKDHAAAQLAQVKAL